jgi:hypothetical protein
VKDAPGDAGRAAPAHHPIVATFSAARLAAYARAHLRRGGHGLAELLDETGWRSIHSTPSLMHCADSCWRESRTCTR